mmetsp:Transcript_23014/g.74284  ORF Transcript_23014/g.74284 Transcript_23014/m.74284 type:complete len:202 (+) Transcript_23014:620-1225(+)
MQLARSVHQHEVDVVDAQLVEHAGHFLEGRVVAERVWPDLRRQKNLPSGHATRDRVPDAAADGGMVQVQRGRVDVSTALQQVPQHGAVHGDVIVGGGPTTHAEPVRRHLVAPWQAQEQLPLGPRSRLEVGRHLVSLWLPEALDPEEGLEDDRHRVLLRCDPSHQQRHNQRHREAAARARSKHTHCCHLGAELGRTRLILTA